MTADPTIPVAVLVGPERFAPYIDACAGEWDEAARLYCWNIEASAAVLGTHAVLEVSIRNALHDRLTEDHGPTWWDTAPIGSSARAEVRAVTQRLNGRRGPDGWTPGHVVAELRASFWEGLLANRHHAALWVPTLVRAFPRLDGRRGDVKERMQRLRLLRNRAAHHEPIHARDLLVDHRFMVELAGMVSEDLRRWIETHSRLPAAVEGRAATIDGRRRTRF